MPDFGVTHCKPLGPEERSANSILKEVLDNKLKLKVVYTYIHATKRTELIEHIFLGYILYHNVRKTALVFFSVVSRLQAEK